jgi:hypothetical protein
MKDLRPPPRPAHRQRPVGDDSGEVLKVVIVALLLTVGLMFVYQYSKPKSLPPVAASPSAPPPGTASMPPQAHYGSTAPLAPVGPSASEWSRLESLRDYCQRMSRMNAGGEYPSLQRSACGDYARYAQAHGFGAVALPEVQEASPQPSRSAPAWTAERRPSRPQTPPGECDQLEDAKQRINAATRQAHSGWQAERYREELRRINARMWDLNCRNH